MHFAIVLFATLAACTIEPEPWSVPGARVRAEAADQDYWRGQVTVAARYWNNALVAVGCSSVFEVVDELDAHPITLIPNEMWPVDEPGLWGRTWSERIEIRDVRPTPNMPTLVHELGHALGLGHARAGEDSVMTPTVGRLIQPTASDVEIARATLGC